MKYKFRQHIPGFVDGVDPYEFEFENIEQLLSHPRIQSLKKNPNFFRFSKADTDDAYHKDFCTLMLEMHEGYEWWVIGFIWGKDNLELPIWEYKTKKE